MVLRPVLDGKGAKRKGGWAGTQFWVLMVDDRGREREYGWGRGSRFPYKMMAGRKGGLARDAVLGSRMR